MFDMEYACCMLFAAFMLISGLLTCSRNMTHVSNTDEHTFYLLLVKHAWNLFMQLLKPFFFELVMLAN
jgi:hypothetical protein